MEIKEISFIAPCPCQKCISNSKLYEWKHDCEKIFSLTIDGNLKCSTCSFETPFIDYKFECDNHSNTENEPTQEGTCHSLSELLKQNHSPQEKEFIIQMMSIFMDKFLTQVKKESSNEVPIMLKMLCPTEKCANKDEIKWRHKKCKGQLTLTIEDDVPTIKCEGRNCKSKGAFYEWKFKCGEKLHNEKMCSVPGVCKAFTKMARGNPGINALLMKMSAKIIEGIRKSSENDNKSNNNDLVAVHEKLLK